MASMASDDRRIRILECFTKSFAELASAIQNINFKIDHDLKLGMEWQIPVAFCHQDVNDGIVSDGTFCQQDWNPTLSLLWKSTINSF